MAKSNSSAPAGPARIEYLKVENYRALRKIELADLTPLTVLLGPNGSGKSTVFDVFNFLSECFTLGLRKAWDKRGRFRELRTRGSDGPVLFELRYRETPESQPATYHLEIDEQPSGPVVVEEWLRWRRVATGGGAPYRILSFKNGRGWAVSRTGREARAALARGLSRGRRSARQRRRAKRFSQAAVTMAVERVEVLVEEPSMEAALELLLPRMLGDVSFGIRSFQGKPDLLGKLADRLRAYAAWIPKSWRIVVIVDRDGDDFDQLKRQLEELARQAGLATRSTRDSHAKYVVVNRIAVEELEAWYFSDWQAVRAAYPRVSSTIPAKAPYRAPDEIQGGTWEAFEHVLQGVGYFAGRLRKIEAARAVARHMVPERNTSPSFCALRDALADMAQPPPRARRDR